MNHDEIRETHDLLLLEARLVQLFGTQLGRAVVHRELRNAYHGFDQAPIRRYVMILTERAAQQRLAARASAPEMLARLRTAGASA